LRIVTLSAIVFGELLAGAVLTDQIFTTFILIHLLADGLYVLPNPRIKASI
jgi:ABC-type dipeptide/oligopeptide/nickel transport system permease component